MRFAQESPSFRTGTLTLVRLKRFMKTIKYIIPILIEHINEISTFEYPPCNIPTPLSTHNIYIPELFNCPMISIF